MREVKLCEICYDTNGRCPHRIAPLLAGQLAELQDAINEQVGIENRLGDSVCLTLSVSRVALLSYALGIATGAVLGHRDPKPAKKAKRKAVRR